MGYFFMNNTDPTKEDRLNDDKCLIDAFHLEEDEVFDARFNLVGFFGALHRINSRLEELKEKHD